MHGVNFREKLISWTDLPAWRANVRARGQRLVVINGCFDVLHLGQSASQLAGRNARRLKKITHRLQRRLHLMAGRVDWLEHCPQLQKSPWLLPKTIVTNR
jgi:hypothetical protein